MRTLWGKVCIWMGAIVSAGFLISLSIASAHDSKKLDSQNLPNLFLVCQGIYSGGQPNGEEAFKELKSLGIRTIISVDGAAPNVDMAAQFEMRYVHIPLGYDGVSLERGHQLARAVSVVEAPIYFHCHHGRHRSPAAAAIACIHLGRLSKPQGVDLLNSAGTSPRYKGLFRSVENASPLTNQALKSIPSDFPAVAELQPMTAAMVEIEHCFDSLKSLKHPESPATQQRTAVLEKVVNLIEQFREIPRLQDPRAKEDAFIKMCQESEKSALFIEGLLTDSSSSPLGARQLESLNAAVKKLDAQCTACHQQFRD